MYNRKLEAILTTPRGEIEVYSVSGVKWYLFVAIGKATAPYAVDLAVEQTRKGPKFIKDKFLKVK